jgi:hypothetical protein
MDDSLLKLKQSFDEKGIFFSLSGPISQDLIVEIGDILKHKMRLEDASKSTILKVFSLLIEQSQNVIHYSVEKLPSKQNINEELHFGIIIVGFADGHYYVIVGNLINNEDIDRLENKLKKIIVLDQNQLKDFYKTERKKERDKISKGAGLGFIEIARKACKPLEYRFEKIDNKHSYFTLKTII